MAGDERAAPPSAAEEALIEDLMEKREGDASGFTCPECNGSLWEKAEGNGNGGVVVGYECRVSHKYSFETLVAAKALEVEAAVWAAINALEERAALLRKSAARARSRGLATVDMPARMLEQARESEQHAEAIRRTLLGSLVAVESRGMTGDGATGVGGAGPISA